MLGYNIFAANNDKVVSVTIYENIEYQNNIVQML